jgi:hypothetical protein
LGGAENAVFFRPQKFSFILRNFPKTLPVWGAYHLPVIFKNEKEP